MEREDKRSRRPREFCRWTAETNPLSCCPTDESDELFALLDSEAKGESSRSNVSGRTIQASDGVCKPRALPSRSRRKWGRESTQINRCQGWAGEERTGCPCSFWRKGDTIQRHLETRGRPRGALAERQAQSLEHSLSEESKDDAVGAGGE